MENIKCPECKQVSGKSTWKETEVNCEDCGTHSAITCPTCGLDIDLVFNNLDDLIV